MNTLRQFEVVCTIARERSISRAASVLKVSQPTLSKLLVKIEEDIGLPLFDRSTFPITLTQAGERYLSAGEKILNADHQLMKELDDIRSGKGGELKLGISASRAPYIVPQLLHRFYAMKTVTDDCRIVIHELTTDKLVEELERGELDLIISLLDDSTRKYAHIGLFPERVLMACPKEWSDEGAENLLRSKTLITLGKGQRLRDAIRAVTRTAESADSVIECQSIELAIELVNSGLGITLAPSYLRSHSKYDHVAFLPFPDEWYTRYAAVLNRNVCVFFRDERFLNSMEKKLIRACGELPAIVDAYDE